MAIQDSIQEVQVSMVNLLKEAEAGGAEPAILQGMAQQIQGFREFVSEAMGEGGQQQPQQRPQGGTVSQEAGAANAIPMQQ